MQSSAFWASFQQAFRLVSRLLVFLGVLGMPLALLRHESPWLSPLAAVLVLALIAPVGCLAYAALAPLRIRGMYGHYGAWVLTMFAATLPVYLLGNWMVSRDQERGLGVDSIQGSWLIYLLGVIAGGLLW